MTMRLDDFHHCFCGKPDCAAEVFEEDDYVHFQGEFYHVNCWWQLLSLPPAYLKDWQAPATAGPLTSELLHEESPSDARWADGRDPVYHPDRNR